MVTQMIKYINNQGLFITPDNMVKNAVYFFASCMVNFGNYTFKNKPINYFGATFAPSGMGKGFVIEEVKEMFLLDEDKIEANYLKSLKPMEVNNGKNDILEYCPSFTNPLEGTIEGLYPLALASSKMKVGSLNLLADEVLDTVTTNAQFYLKLKELYDGNMSGKVQKTDPSFSKPLRKIKCNTLIFGTSHRLNEPKVLQSVINLYDSGFYRRSFTVVEMPQKTKKREGELLTQTEILDLKIAIKKFRACIFKNVLDKKTTDISISTNAQTRFNQIQDELLEFQNSNIDDIKYATEFTASSKIIKLSAVLAIMNCRDEIETEDIDEAYQFHLECREDIQHLFANKVRFVMIFDALIKKPLSQTEIMTQFNIKTVDEFVKEFALVKEHITLQKAKLLTITKRNNIKYYEVKK